VSFHSSVQPHITDLNVVVLDDIGDKASPIMRVKVAMGSAKGMADGATKKLTAPATSDPLVAPSGDASLFVNVFVTVVDNKKIGFLVRDMATGIPTSLAVAVDFKVSLPAVAFWIPFSLQLGIKKTIVLNKNKKAKQAAAEKKAKAKKKRNGDVVKDELVTVVVNGKKVRKDFVALSYVELDAIGKAKTGDLSLRLGALVTPSIPFNLQIAPMPDIGVGLYDARDTSLVSLLISGLDKGVDYVAPLNADKSEKKGLTDAETSRGSLPVAVGIDMPAAAVLEADKTRIDSIRVLLGNIVNKRGATLYFRGAPPTKKTCMIQDVLYNMPMVELQTSRKKRAPKRRRRLLALINSESDADADDSNDDMNEDTLSDRGVVHGDAVDDNIDDDVDDNTDDDAVDGVDDLTAFATRFLSSASLQSMSRRLLKLDTGKLLGGKSVSSFLPKVVELQALTRKRVKKGEENLAPAMLFPASGKAKPSTLHRLLYNYSHGIDFNAEADVELPFPVYARLAPFHFTIRVPDPTNSGKTVQVGTAFVDVKGVTSSGTDSPKGKGRSPRTGLPMLSGRVAVTVSVVMHDAHAVLAQMEKAKAGDPGLNAFIVAGRQGYNTLSTMIPEVQIVPKDKKSSSSSAASTTTTTGGKTVETASSLPPLKLAVKDSTSASLRALKVSIDWAIGGGKLPTLPIDVRVGAMQLGISQTARSPAPCNADGKAYTSTGPLQLATLTAATIELRKTTTSAAVHFELAIALEKLSSTDDRAADINYIPRLIGEFVSPKSLSAKLTGTASTAPRSFDARIHGTIKRANAGSAGVVDVDISSSDVYPIAKQAKQGGGDGGGGGGGGAGPGEKKKSSMSLIKSVQLLGSGDAAKPDIVLPCLFAQGLACSADPRYHQMSPVAGIVEVYNPLKLPFPIELDWPGVRIDAFTLWHRRLASLDVSAIDIGKSGVITIDWRVVVHDVPLLSQVGAITLASVNQTLTL
jgi:hypothetical protein